MISDSLLASASVVPAVERGQRGPQPDRAGHAVEHHVARRRGAASVAASGPAMIRGTR